MIPASGEMNRQHAKSSPVTTEARPVRAPSPMPAELSMNVVFEEADAAPPPAAASESTSSTRFIPGSRPSGLTSSARRPSPSTVPAVSKKSESSTDSTTATRAPEAQRRDEVQARTCPRG